MSLITIVLTLVIIGVILWAVNKYIPMQPAIKTVLNLVVLIVVLVWLIQLLVPGVADIRVGG